MNKWGKLFWIDLGERVGATFLGALLAMFTLDMNTPVDWGDPKAVWIVLGVPTLVSLIKGLLGNLASPVSGASLVPANDGGPVVSGPARGQLGQYGIINILVFIVVVLVLLWLIFGLLIPALR